jgi:diamine N-acetyltransferase
MSETERPIFNIEGELVALGPISRDFIPAYLRWMNDFSVTGMLAIQPRPMTMEQEIAWFEHASRDEKSRTFTIFERATGRAIGNCGLGDLDFRHRRGEVGILIGEVDCRGKGYGTEAMRLLLDYAFTAVGLHSVMLWVYEYNFAARRCYEKVGFRESGRRREARWFSGRYWDKIMMDLLESEFESPVLKKLLEPDAPR